MPKILKTDIPGIVSRFLAGETSGDIAPTYQVSRARILQVLRSAGIDTKQGGRSVRPKRVRQAKTEKKVAKILRDYGVDLETYLGWGKTVRDAYTAHKLNCKRRGFGWDFNLDTWALAWEASGHWEMRGKGKVGTQPKFVMAQPDKSKPIGPDNYAIVTLGEALKGKRVLKVQPQASA